MFVWGVISSSSSSRSTKVCVRRRRNSLGLRGSSAQRTLLLHAVRAQSSQLLLDLLTHGLLDILLYCRLLCLLPCLLLRLCWVAPAAAARCCRCRCRYCHAGSHPPCCDAVVLQVDMMRAQQQSVQQTAWNGACRKRSADHFCAVIAVAWAVCGVCLLRVDGGRSCCWDEHVENQKATSPTHATLFSFFCVCVTRLKFQTRLAATERCSPLHASQTAHTTTALVSHTTHANTPHPFRRETLVCPPPHPDHPQHVCRWC